MVKKSIKSKLLFFGFDNGDPSSRADGPRTLVAMSLGCWPLEY